MLDVCFWSDLATPARRRAGPDAKHNLNHEKFRESALEQLTDEDLMGVRIDSPHPSPLIQTAEGM